MANQVTCCPHCNTSFRITNVQLQTAKGAVRCGSCLKIFKALDHIKVTNQAPVKKINGSNPEDSLTVEAKSDNAKTSTDCLTIPDIDWNEPAKNKPAKAEPIAVAKPKTFTRKFVLNDAEPKPERKTKPDAEPAEKNIARNDDDELIGDDNIDNDDAGDFSDEFIRDSGGAEKKGTLFDRQITQKTNTVEDNSDESWAEDLLLNDDKPNVDENDDILPDEKIDQNFLRNLVDEPAKDNNIDTDDINNTKLINSIGDAPVEMQWHDTQSPWPRRLLWSSLSLIMALFLTVQVGWLKYDTLSRIEPYRGVYQLICPLAGCQTPNIQDIKLVKAYNLVVRSHPKASNALAIDSILLNRAEFQQPFPTLMLMFSDLNGVTVAQREFSPAEYLGGELAGVTQMPSKQPVHIALEIIDPGSTAVNYQVIIMGE
jgi:predicted Zn finger-like uncharacterized protein